MSSFISSSGLAYLWSKIKEYISANTGTYSKPSGGIPKSDLASTVLASLDKADTALLSHQSVSNKNADIGTSLTTIATIGSTDIKAKITHQDISGKADKSATVSTVAYDTTNKKLTKTINGSTTDVVTAAKIVTDGGGITSHQDISGKADKSTTTTAGTYRSVTVNSSGIVTGGTNPTTLSGYGITDANIVNGTITLGSNTITPLASGNPIYFVKGTQTAKTGAWTGVIDAPALTDGMTIAYYLPYAGDGNATLNLTLSGGGTTGAVNCYYSGSSRLTTHYGAGSTIIMTYYSAGSISISGTATTDNRWSRCEYDSTITYRLTDYYGYYKAYTALYDYQICLTKDEEYVLPVNTVNASTATNKTLTTESFNPFAPIYYYSSTTDIAAGGNIGANVLAYQYLADLRYSFNTGSTFTARKAVYLVATLGSGCSATLAPNPISQTLPTTEDGYIYIYLGQTYDNYRIELSVRHPVYRYINGALRTISADSATVNGLTVQTAVPANAVFTDTTYESKAAASGGTDVSLVTTGEKATWNGKQNALTFDGTYNASSNKAATVSTVTNAINALDGGTIGTGGAGKTITSLSQTNGNVSATFADISITKSQISDFPTSMTPASHTHGNISNTGTLTDTAAAAAGNDYVVIRDADNAKILTSTIKGTDVADAVSKKHSHSTLTLSTTAQAYDGSHTLALPSSDPYTSARTPSAHNQASNTINAMTGYSKGSSSAAVAATDTLNAAISKLENQIDTKTSNTGTITGVSVNGTSVATSGVANITSVPASILSGAIANGVTATTQSSGDNSTKVATTAYVDTAVSNLPEPMIFKGSLGTGGTITSLPTASSSNEGYTYKVITAGTYASQAAKVGDTFISDGSAWVLIPSGDEPSGTVTSVTIKATSPIAIDSSSAITTSGTRTLSHANSGVSAGTYRSVTVNATGHVTAGTNPTTLSGYGITDAKIASGTITLGSNSITPLTSYTETDPVFSASAASGITSNDITNWNNKTSNVGTITGIKMNGVSKGTSGVVDLGTVITAHLDISGKANLASPAFTGTPTAPTAAAGTSTTQIATTAFVLNELSGQFDEITGIIEDNEEVVSSALNDLNSRLEDEKVIASALNDLNERVDENEVVTAAALNDLNSNKQNKLVSGTNIKTINNQSLLGEGNITISGGGSGGDVNVIETVKVNGTALTPDANKAVNVTVPTESTVSGWGFTKNAGTITGITGSNGLTGSGTSGSVTISHAAPSTSPAKTTLAVYPIKIDQYGHITAAGTAVTIPSAPGTLNTNNTTAQTASSSEALSGTIKLHKVAKTGTYSDLIGTPTNVSTFTNDANYVTSNNTVAIYSGSSAPSSSLGKNGDIYILTS